MKYPALIHEFAFNTIHHEVTHLLIHKVIDGVASLDFAPSLTNPLCVSCSFSLKNFDMEYNLVISEGKSFHTFMKALMKIKKVTLTSLTSSC